MASRFSVQAVFNAVDRVTGPVRKISRGVRGMSQRAERNLRRIDRVNSKISRGFMRIGGAAAKGLGAISTAAAGAITMLNRSSTRSQRLADSVGGNVDKLEAIAGAIAPAGFELEHMIDLVEEMNNKIGESKGLEELSRPTSEALQILNIEFDKLQKLSPGDQFELIADKALKMEDAQKAAAAADILMGGEASKLIGVLRQQGGSMEEITDRFGALNKRTEESRAGASRFTSALNEAQFLTTSLAQEVAGLAGKQLVPLIRRYTEWVSANSDLVKSRILDWISDLRENLSTIWMWVKRIGTVLAVFYTFQAVVKTLTGTMILFNAVMAANPITLIALAIASLVGLIVLLVSHWEKLPGPVREFFSVVQRTVGRLLSGVLAGLKAIAPAILWAWDKFVEGWRINFMIAGKIIEVFAAGVKATVNAVVALPGLLMDAWQGFKDFWTGLWEGIKSTMSSAADVVMGIVNRVTGAVSSVISSARSVAGLLGFGDDDDAEDTSSGVIRGARPGPPPSMVSPQERIAREVRESSTVDRNTVTIRDETGRARDETGKGGGPGVNLQLSGAL